MASMTATTCFTPVTTTRVAARPSKAATFGRVAGLRAPLRTQTAVVPAPRVMRPVVAQAMPQEVAQLAFDAGFIWSIAGISAAMTLVGVSVGFVLLRVEALVEEGKL